MNNNLPDDIVFTDGVQKDGKQVWFLTRCASSDCKEMWYFSHEVDSIVHNEDNTHTIEYDGMVLEQTNS
jgi:hypothetical protein